ncbi:hypothetical protein CBR_g53496 [Chara braunii]|uniref:non-specific serine/threonine protein kinase n=1 Tax=Chara braunii TaxID=69332 RepID=A0A388MB40_CHABU|nr:hypothetical protein CBR_g53496 [Chara braunii]|eukprot:GBG91682.1 hypothetical protein CBR_g53496 [Chara braunii]
MANSGRLLRSWEGRNACEMWEGVHCFDRRVAFLTLTGKGIRGTLPPEIAQLERLVLLDLSWNEFYGQVPDVVASMPKLSSLNIEDNYFNYVPVAFLSRLNMTILTNNCLQELSGSLENDRNGSSSTSLMQKPESVCDHFYRSKSRHMLDAWKFGLVLGSLALAGIVAIGWIISCRRKMSHHLDAPTGCELNEYPLQELLDVTNNFSDATLLGRGADGMVFQIDDLRGEAVAVRRLDRRSVKGGASSFRVEVVKFSRPDHPNIAKLLGFCGDEGERMLVYEYVEGGSLHDHVHDLCNPLLAWHQRMKILVGIAKGLSHLHHDLDPPVIHGGLKSSSVLLSEDLTPKIADVGLMMMLHGGRGSNGLLTKAVDAKNMGYMDPALIQKPSLTMTSDVFAYGVLLLEVITGRKAFQYGQSLAVWARPILDARDRWKELADARLKRNYEQEELIAVVEVAVDCIQDNVRQRPLIRDVAEMLEAKVKASLDIPSDTRNRAGEEWVTDPPETGPESGLSCCGNVDCSYHIIVQDTLIRDSAALQTHGIWSNTIGYDPYAPENKDVPKPEGGTDIGNAYDNYQGLLALARLTGSNADEQRGSCKKCGRVGHLTFQCKNFLSSKESIALEGGSAPNAAQTDERSDLDTSDEDDDLDDDSSEDSEMERAIREMKTGPRMDGLRSRGRKEDGSLHKEGKKRPSRPTSPSRQPRSSGSRGKHHKSKDRSSSRKSKHRRYGSAPSDDSSEDESSDDEDDRAHHRHRHRHSEAHRRKKDDSQTRRRKHHSLEEDSEGSRRRKGRHADKRCSSSDGDSSDSDSRVKKRRKNEHDKRKREKGVQEGESDDEALMRDRKASSSKDVGRHHKRSKSRHGGVDCDRDGCSADEAEEGGGEGRTRRRSRRRLEGLDGEKKAHSGDESEGEKGHSRREKKDGRKEQKRRKRDGSADDEEDSTVDEDERRKSSKTKKEKRKSRRRRRRESASSSESGKSSSSEDEQAKHSERKKIQKATGKDQRTKDKSQGGDRNVDRHGRGSQQASDSDSSEQEEKKGRKR